VVLFLWGCSFIKRLLWLFCLCCVEGFGEYMNSKVRRSTDKRRRGQEDAKRAKGGKQWLIGVRGVGVSLRRDGV